MQQTTSLLRKEQLANGTTLFTFTRPEGFEYEAGQTVDLTLIDPPETDGEGPSRTFSLVSAAHEADLAVATRMRDTAYKRVLAAMPLGTELNLEGPFGSFTLHENAARPAVFLAGGIGVTPFRSIIADAVARGLPHELVLFYSNREPGDAAFLEELRAFARAHPSLTVVPTMTRLADTDTSWGGERGHIDTTMLDRHQPTGAVPIYYIAGPPNMVHAMRALLKERGVSGDDIRFEEFAGY